MKNGAPALILDVMENENPVFQNLADITCGSVVPARDQEKTVQEISNYLDQIKPPTYIFEYNSRSRKSHEVEVNIFEKNINAKDSYEFAPKNGDEAGLISLQLEVVLGSQRFKKELAGADTSDLYNLYYSKKSNKSLSTYRNEVRGFLMGGAQLYIESEGPTLSTAISDVLKAQLSNRGWGEAFLNNDMKLAKEHYEKGNISLSGSLLSLLTQPKLENTEDSLTYASGYRLAMVKTIWPIDGQDGRNTFDYFQSSGYKTIGGNEIDNFKKTAYTTAQLSIREASIFNNSTLEALSNSKLISNKNFKAIEDRKLKETLLNKMYKIGNRKRLLDPYNYILFDNKLENFCYWKIDKKTGELYGMLADGTGGAGNPMPYDPSLEDLLSLLLNIVGILDKMMIIATSGGLLANPLGGASLAIIAKYGVTLGKIYGIVTQTIIVMDAAGMDENIKKELQVFACEVYKEIVFNIFGNAGATFAGLESLIGMLSPDTKSPFSCSQ